MEIDEVHKQHKKQCLSFLHASLNSYLHAMDLSGRLRLATRDSKLAKEPPLPFVHYDVLLDYGWSNIHVVVEVSGFFFIF